jgi:ribosomal protein S18 acetylase RimI-like enzyme
VIAVRAVRAADATRLREFRLRALADTPGAFAATAEQEAGLPASHWSELALQSELADHVVIYVAGDGVRWIGMAAGRWHDRDHGIAHLWAMWVDPAARRLGIGDRLVTEVRGWAAAHGARFVRLGVITADDDATPFYERLGFVRTGETAPLRREPTRSAHYLARPV